MSAAKHSRPGLYAECHACGEIWRVAVFPLALRVGGSLSMRNSILLAAALSKVRDRDLQCPGCTERSRVGLCPIDGPRAPSGPRKGRR